MTSVKRQQPIGSVFHEDCKSLRHLYLNPVHPIFITVDLNLLSIQAKLLPYHLCFDYDNSKTIPIRHRLNFGKFCGNCIRVTCGSCQPESIQTEICFTWSSFISCYSLLTPWLISTKSFSAKYFSKCQISGRSEKR